MEEGLSIDQAEEISERFINDLPEDPDVSDIDRAITTALGPAIESGVSESTVMEVAEDVVEQLS